MERTALPPANGICHCNKIPVIAHELAQSLSIISSYIKGCTERVKKDNLNLDQFITVFEKIIQQVEIMDEKIHCMI